MSAYKWEIVPNFNDARAKCKEERDELGNITKIEILYGGEGGGDGKGHGHWVAELIDGLLQVVLDREPDSAGGRAQDRIHSPFGCL
ncbi:MAG: hypothetical protein LBD25_01280 [Coriobacteriales bacterium]|jgi:hypothetical protein|nr:hypothetical protein [Coriobacteriales bacterium]